MTSSKKCFKCETLNSLRSWRILTVHGMHDGTGVHLQSAHLCDAGVDGSNNSARTIVPACDGCIKLAGGGGSVGQTLGFAAGPFAAQLESASVEASDNNVSGVLRILFLSLIHI